jgi:nucleotidyltransferase/DNA polymerase involved in DNA repair
MELADDIAMTARRHGKKGHRVHISLKFTDFSVISGR